MRPLPALLLAAALLSPALAEEEVIPEHAFQSVYENWKDLLGGRVVVTGGFVAQVGKYEHFAVLTDGKTSAFIEIDTSQAIDPATVKALEDKCESFLTDEIAECRLDVVGTVEKNPNVDFPVLTQPNFVTPAR